MSVSSRLQRATVYPYLGVNDGGFATSSYGAARGTYWCRLSAMPGEELILDGQVAQTQRATIEFADEVPVGENDLIEIDGVQWQAGPVTARLQQRAKILRVTRNTEAAALPHA
jgi:hypothetical protein